MHDRRASWLGSEGREYLSILFTLARVRKAVRLLTISYSSGAHDNGISAWSVAKPVIQTGSTSRQLVAAARTFTMVTEADVVGRTETVCAWSGKAGGSAVVDGAWTTAHIVDSMAAVCDHGVLCTSGGKRIVNNRLADEGELRVGGSKPVPEFGLADDVRVLC